MRVEMQTEIDLANVSMCFRTYGDALPSFKQTVLKKLLRRESSQRREFWLYRDLNLTIEHGSRVGILGPNGAGKSTLLRMICGIYHPTKGTIRVTGRVAPLIEIGAGMLPELSGAENIVLNGVLLGFRHREMLEKVDRIIDFAGLQEFRDMPIKYYSTGMLMRLAFSTATDIDPEILLIDEVFGGGDAEFVERAKARMNRLLDDSNIVVLVSHQLELIKQVCTRAIWIERGRIVQDGEPSTVTEQYLESIPTEHAAAP